MKPLLLGVCLVLLGEPLVAPCAHAFDGSRRGFVLGFGAGPGVLAADFELESIVGFQTDLKIGGGISDRTLIHYTGKQYWFSEDEVFFTLANPFMGVTHYFSESSPSVFVTGGAGLSIVAAIWRESGVAVGGVGSFGGLGYEFVPHWNVELDVIYNRFTDINLWNFTLTVNLLGY